MGEHQGGRVGDRESSGWKDHPGTMVQGNLSTHSRPPCHFPKTQAERSVSSTQPYRSHSHQLLTPPRPSPRRPSPSSRPAPSTPRYTARLTPSRQPSLSSTSKARYTARTGLEVNPIQPPRFLPSPRAVLRSPSKEGQKQSVGFTPLRQTLLSRRSAVDRSRLATSPQRAALDDQQEGEEEEDAKPTLEQLFDSLRQTYQGGPIDLCSSDESSSASDGAGFSDDNIWSDQEEEEEDEFDAFPPTDSRPLSPSKSTSSSSTSSTHRSTSLAHQRLSSSLRLLSTWEALLEKYNLPLEQDDEIDLTSGQLVVDRGVLKGSLGYMGRRYFLSGLTGVGDGSEGEDAEEGVDEGEDDEEEEEDLGGGQTIENHPFFGIDTSGQTDG